jgi:hypothetical protein
LHHSFAVSTGASYYSLGDADTTRPGDGVKSKKNVFEKSMKDAEKNRVSTGWRTRFSNRSRASRFALRCAKPVDFVLCRSFSNFTRAIRPVCAGQSIVGQVFNPVIVLSRPADKKPLKTLIARKRRIGTNG